MISFGLSLNLNIVIVRMCCDLCGIFAPYFQISAFSCLECLTEWVLSSQYKLMLIEARPRLVFFFWIATRGKIMKRILLTTTSLVLAAGFASADVSFSGTAGVALIDDNGASVVKSAVVGAQGTGTAADTAAVAAVARSTRDGMFFESYYDLDITATAESDNGISVKLGLDIGSGGKIDYDDDDKLEVQSAAPSDADVAVSYNG